MPSLFFGNFGSMELVNNLYSDSRRNVLLPQPTKPAKHKRLNLGEDLMELALELGILICAAIT